jgi:BCD family chlorophyll transporter-like MFS transporter
MAEAPAVGLALAVVDFALIGFGVGAAGTSLLALLAASVAPHRRPAAATIVWLMMIAGMAVTAILAGAALEPFTFGRLVGVVAVTAMVAVLSTVVALFGLEKRLASRQVPVMASPRVSFRESLRDAWADRRARLFTVFVFVSMLAFSAQDLILEPFAGLAFGLTPGETTGLAGLQHGGVFAGMVVTGLVGSLWSRWNADALRILTLGGCVASAFALAGLSLAAGSGGDWPIEVNVLALGLANGCFAVSAIGSMMALAGAAGPGRTGMRMGLWGAAQGIAFGAGGLAGAAGVDAVTLLGGDTMVAYGAVFAAEAGLFALSAAIAARIAVGWKARSTPIRSAPGVVAAE